jgi:formylglycine-generating enzyme required for sulfatase activity
MSEKNTPPPAEQPQKQQPDGDYLGYGDYADTLWARILAAVNKDAETIQKARDNGRKNALDGDPLVVGIFGEWGAGKSKLLSLVRERAQSHLKTLQKTRSSNVGFELTVPVFFQPWKYEHEPHLHVPMIMHITAALKDALKAEPGLLSAVQSGMKKTFWGGTKVAAMVHPGAKVASAVYPLLQTAVGSFSAFGTSLSLPDELGDWLEDAADASSDLPDALEKLEKRKDSKAQERTKRQISHSNEGMYFYRIHEYLEKITRPGEHKDLAGDLQDTASTKNTRINFIIFIDDLDRCLPEKAVETLELIKTIFNAESFAFVLALDEEVVERGIGHRYKDYALAGKKPEMPITGFEYLEKIVHLPFRLPALTRQQALTFMQRYENGLLLDRAKNLSLPAQTKTDDAKQEFRKQWIAQRTWLGKPEITARPISTESPATGRHELPDAINALAGKFSRHGAPSSASGVKPTLAHLVVNSFDAYVPRKLIRIIELLHQVLDVLEKRGRLDKLQVSDDKANGAIDPRLLMAFLLLQLFHPDLYRTFRRTRVGFEEVLDAFNKNILGQATSDLDLWRWAAIGYDAAQLANPDKQPPATYEKAVLMIRSIESTARFKAQQIYLPIAQRLVEHRAAQRHVFDPLRLFASLKGSNINPSTLDGQYSRTYYSLLTRGGANPLDGEEYLEVMPASVVVTANIQDQADTLEAQVQTGEAMQTELTTAPANPPKEAKPPATRPRRAGDADTLFDALVSTAEREQQKVATNVGLQEGEWLDAHSANELHQRLSKWLLGVSPEQKDEVKGRLLRGLQYLAPHIASDSSQIFWDLVKDVTLGEELGSQITNLDQLQARALWADVQSTLGQDLRFDRDTLYGEKKDGEGKTIFPGVPLYLLNARRGWTNPSQSAQEASAIEPIPGFVHIPGGTFQMGQAEESDNVPRDVTIEKPFYIARYLTTVDQYASFVDDGGYAKDGLWDTQGIEWREGRFDSKVENKDYGEYLAHRTPDLRKQPMDWNEQRSRGSCPVMRLSWFEARAYTRWLQERLSGMEPHEALLAPQGALAGYRVALPTEAQWERAARAQDLTSSDPKRVWPWEGDDKTAHLKANIAASKIGRASVVGLFEPNPAGLHDMAGNLWEWQDNLYDGKGDTVQRRLAKDKELKSLEDLDKSDRPALRGGSWSDAASFARCSSRFRSVPDLWSGLVGFRVVLSLANLKSET